MICESAEVERLVLQLTGFPTRGGDRVHLPDLQILWSLNAKLLKVEWHRILSGGEPTFPTCKFAYLELLTPSFTYRSGDNFVGSSFAANENVLRAQDGLIVQARFSAANSSTT